MNISLLLFTNLLIINDFDNKQFIIRYYFSIKNIYKSNIVSINNVISYDKFQFKRC